MDLRTLVLSFRRRWYLVVMAIAVAAGSTFFVTAKVGPSYTAEASVLLLPPPSTSVEGNKVVPNNPYLSLGGLDPARDILVRAMTSRSMRLSMEKEYPNADYDLLPDNSVSGPLISIQTSAPSASEALKLLGDLVERTPKSLLNLQTDLKVDNNVRITAETLTADPKAEVVRKGQIRIAIVTAAGMMVAGLLAIALLDGLLMARRQSRELKAAGQDSAPRGLSSAGEPASRIVSAVEDVVPRVLPTSSTHEHPRGRRTSSAADGLSARARR